MGKEVNSDCAVALGWKPEEKRTRPELVEQTHIQNYQALNCTEGEW